MNIQSVNQKSQVMVDNNRNAGPGMMPSFQKGQVIEGLITKVSDKISISFSDREVRVSKSTVQNAREGEIRQFEVTDISDAGIVLKEVGGNAGAGSRKILCTMVDTNQAAALENTGKASVQEDQSLKESEERLSNIKERMSPEDYDKLMEEGKVLEAYDLVRLERALERIKEQRRQQEEGIVRQTEQQTREQEQVKEILRDDSGKGTIHKEIADRLEALDFPATEANIAKIASALELSKATGELSERAMVYLIGNDLEITVENLYKAQFSGNYGESKEISQEQWKQLETAAQEVIENAGFVADAKTMDEARWLLEKDLPLTGENLQKLQSLKDISLQTGQDKVLDSILQAMEQGKKPEEALLDNSLDKMAQQAVEDFQTVSDDAVIDAVRKNHEITLNSLKTAEKTAEKGQIIITEELFLSGEVDIRTITAKRQLEEIRLKMSVEAGRKLLGKGINVNTENLQRVVEELRNLENSYYKNLLEETEASQSEENISLLSETLEKISGLKSAPSYLLGSTFSTRNIQTVESLYQEGCSLKNSLEKAHESYEALMTAPRKDMGDSIQKAFQNVDDILRDLGMEATRANQRAVKILGYSRMDITPESVLQMKEYDSKVNELLKNFHPAVAADFIKEGRNPLEIPVDELNQELIERKESLDITQDEKYSKYLWRLEKDKGISAEERNAYIGIYRLLDKVEKSGGAAVGALVKAGREINLKNLLTSVRTIKSEGISVGVNDEFGGLEGISFPSETISEQLSYFERMVRNTKNILSPEGLQTISEKGDLYGMSLEALSQKLEEAGGYQQNDYSTVRTGELGDLAENSRSGMELLNGLKLPETIQNIAAAAEYRKGETAFKKLMEIEDYTAVSEDMEALVEGLSEHLADCGTMVRQYEKIEEKVRELLENTNEKEIITAKELAGLKSVKGGFELIGSMSRRESYEVPLLIEGRITNINLTLVHGEEESGKVKISVESEKIGSVKADFTVNNNQVRGLVLCSERQGLEAVRGESANLEEMLLQSGLILDRMDYGIDHKISESYIGKGTIEAKAGERAGETATPMLYQLSRAFVYNIKSMEQRQYSEKGFR